MNSQPTITYPTIVKGQSATFAQSAAEQDRGGMAMNYVFVQHNRVYKGGESFEIPWSNKELNITYSTFRDKLLPGANEKWTVKISGSKGEKVAAEMLAAMYDASLDQFKPHGWSRLNVWPSLYNSLYWEENAFEKVESEEFRALDYIYPNGIRKLYDKIGLQNSDGDLNDWMGFERYI
ncbi:MAG: hypothetical protein WDM90_02705 [Ferruginibacter sp.]